MKTIMISSNRNLNENIAIHIWQTRFFPMQSYGDRISVAKDFLWLIGVVCHLVCECVRAVLIGFVSRFNTRNTV